MSDTISNFITIIRNASSASHASCRGLFSKVHLGIAQKLKECGYIEDYKEIDAVKGSPKQIEVILKYVDDDASLAGIERVSKPGRRVYCGCTEIPKVLGGLGTAILSTPKGILTDRQARQQKLGGEILCNVW